MMISNRSAASHVWTALKTWKLQCAFKVLVPLAGLHGQSLCRSLDHDGFESLGSFSCLGSPENMEASVRIQSSHAARLPARAVFVSELGS